jgi:hypothetical protein
MKKSLDEIIQKIELEKNSKKQQEQLIDDEIFQQREKQRLQYLKDCKMYESLSQSNSPSSAGSGGGGSLVDSWISYYNTAWLYPHINVDPIITQYKGLSPSLVQQQGNELIFANIADLYSFYSACYVSTAASQPVGNPGYSLGVGTILKDLGETLHLGLDSGLRIVTWRLVEQLTEQTTLPSAGNSPNRTIGFVPIYSDWDEDGSQDDISFNPNDPPLNFFDADPVRVKLNGTIRFNL